MSPAKGLAADAGAAWAAMHSSQAACAPHGGHWFMTVARMWPVTPAAAWAPPLAAQAHWQVGPRSGSMCGRPDQPGKHHRPRSQSPAMIGQRPDAGPESSAAGPAGPARAHQARHRPLDASAGGRFWRPAPPDTRQADRRHGHHGRLAHSARPGAQPVRPPVPMGDLPKVWSCCVSLLQVEVGPAPRCWLRERSTVLPARRPTQRPARRRAGASYDFQGHVAFTVGQHTGAIGTEKRPTVGVANGCTARKPGMGADAVMRIAGLANIDVFGAANQVG